MPALTVATTRRSEQFAESGDLEDITTAIITDVTGEEYDVSVSSSDEGKKRLKDRARAAYVLDHTHEPSVLGFRMDHLENFTPGDQEDGPTGQTAVLIMPHIPGDAFPLSRLTETQCAATGTSIGAIHRLRGKFLVNAHYPAFPAATIHHQLETWIVNLRAAGHIPPEILDNWTSIISHENLWNFRATPVHGGFNDGDIIFTSTGISGIRHWENMQINDPARDLAWIFTKLNQSRRNAALSAYARIMGNRMDDMIMLRAGLWVQMSQVGDFIRALEKADTQKIMRFKSQVESLAHQIFTINPEGVGKSAHPTTLTVGDLLGDSTQGGKSPVKRSVRHAQPGDHARFVADQGMRSGENRLNDSTVSRTVANPPKSVRLNQDGGQANPAGSRIPLPPQTPEDQLPENYDSDPQTQVVNWSSTPGKAEDFNFVSTPDSALHQGEGQGGQNISSDRTSTNRPDSAGASDDEETLAFQKVKEETDGANGEESREPASSSNPPSGPLFEAYRRRMDEAQAESDSAAFKIDDDPDDIATEAFVSQKKSEEDHLQ